MPSSQTHSHLQKNLAALRAKHALAKNLADFVATTDDARYVVSHNGEQASLKIQISDKDSLIAEAPDVPRLIHNTFAGLNKPKALYLVLGCGLGGLFKEVVRRFPLSPVLLVEHDAMVFKKALETTDLSQEIANPNVQFAIGLDTKSLRYFLKHFLHTEDVSNFLPNVITVQHAFSVHLSKSYYENFGKVFEDEVNFFWESAVGNSCFDQGKGLRETVPNLSHLPRMLSFEPYKSSYSGYAGIVVSSGPSLDSKLEHLKRVQDKALIVCADSALKKLLQNGIKPFGVACVERDEVNAKCFLGFEIPKDVILFAPPLVRHELIETYPGPIVTLWRQAFPFNWLPPFLPAWDFGLSCAHLCYKVLTFLGATTIGLVGQDLAYDRKSGSSHFQNIHHFCTDQFENPDMKRIETEDNQGGKILTNENWLSFRNIFEGFLEADRKVTCLNVIEKEFGLKIKGSVVTKTDDFFTPLEKAPRVKPFSPEAGKVDLAKRLPSFLAEWQKVKSESLTGLKRLLASLSLFSHNQNFEEYKATTKKLRDEIGERTFKLYKEFFKPYLRRFEANANCLWSESEFQKQMPALLKEFNTYVPQMIEILETAPITRS
jgi:hypothetical protein